MSQDDYATAIFEDGTVETIPQSWIQDYLQEDEKPDYIETSEQWESKYPRLVFWNKVKQLEKQQFTMDNIAATLVEIKDAVMRLQKNIDRLMSVASGEEELEIDLSQAAKDIQHFLAVEDYVKVKKNYDNLVKNLARIGGRNVESTTRKIWASLCSNTLASTICWTGANGKYCLKPLLLNKVVRDAVLLTHPHGKEAQIQKTTMLWFSHAQDRLRGKNIKVEM